MAEIEKAQTTHDEGDTRSAEEEMKRQITVDTVHNDEAVKVLANYTGDETWTPQEEKKLVRKIDLRLLTILCLTYGLQYYDKAMLSQAVCQVASLFNRC